MFFWIPKIILQYNFKIERLFINKNLKHLIFPAIQTEEYPTQNERYVCTESIAALLADIGQVGIGRKAGKPVGRGPHKWPYQCISLGWRNPTFGGYKL